GSLFSQAPITPELPARAAILTSRPWSPAARYLQSTPCRHVCANSAAVERPDRPCPAAPGAACPDTFQAAAGAARDHGYRHWAHLLLPVFPPAFGLGPDTPGQLQEAGVMGAVLSLTPRPDRPGLS
ncbi:hypothetical protein JEQ12_011178, partial [Ovis aries]